MLRHLSRRSARLVGARRAFSTQRNKFLADKLQPFSGSTVWHEFTPLAVKYGAVNLGQGFPGWYPPQFAMEHMQGILAPENEQPTSMQMNGVDVPTSRTFMTHQYARSQGHEPLCRVLAAMYRDQYGRQEINPLTEVIVTNGASGGLYNVCDALLNPGDEVVLLEPYFDLYVPGVEANGGVVRSVPLRLKNNETGFGLDMDELEAALSPRTKFILLNTPHNPTGAVLNREALEQLAAVLRKPEHQHVLAVCDEVYEHLVFGDAAHTSLCALGDDMWERTLTVSSAGKTFSMTGHKVGWVMGSSELVSCIQNSQQWTVFSVHTPSQEVVARSLCTASQQYSCPESGAEFDTYFDWLRDDYGRKKEILLQGLKRAGLPYVNSDGSFFVLVDTSAVDEEALIRAEDADGQTGDVLGINPDRDWNVSKQMIRLAGVATIPPSAFCSPTNKDLMTSYARFAFCRPDEQIEQAVEQLAVFMDKFGNAQ